MRSGKILDYYLVWSDKILHKPNKKANLFVDLRARQYLLVGEN